MRLEIYTSYEGERGTSLSRNGKITISKLKLSYLSQILIETLSYVTDKSMSKTMASVSGGIFLIQLNFSVMYLTYYLFKIRIINIEQVI